MKPSSGPVPSQFKGLARQFIDWRIDESRPFITATNAQVVKLGAHIERPGKTIRPERMQDVERAMRETTPFPESHRSVPPSC